MNKNREILTDKVILKILWIHWFIYMVWLFARAFGIINTPFLLQNIHLFLGGTGIIFIFITVGRYMERFNNLERDVRILKRQVSKNTLEIAKINAKI